MARSLDTSMGDPERELADALEAHRGSGGEPLAGLFNLTRRMENEQEEQFDVDLTIMDFLAYKATDLVFEWRAGSNPHQSDLPSALVTMTAEWRTFLKHKHSGKRLNSQAAFRSRLLQFSLLFTHRLNHEQTWTTEESLNELRAQNRKRGQYWNDAGRTPALQRPFDPSSEFPLADGALAENRHNLACAIDQPQERRRWVTDLEGTPTLHCLLPLFVELTAARVQLGDWVPSEGWMDLMGQFMLHAVLEEYLLNGAYSQETFNTIFAFGCPGTEHRSDEGGDVVAMRSIFCSDAHPHQEIPGWSEVRQRYVQELLPPPNSSTSFVQAMERAQELHPYEAFENSTIAFLEYLHDELIKPDLVQVEEGRVNIHGNELPESDSREMIRRMGL
ncbi:hypothetical protein DPSP01_005207 [Paraphaeosphaeria sporulosa]|uniref:Uncharacterized protein n=1 Tax=Paraphaeosphaeria sporulosa TaxID=1460663 RepID=A0A177BZB7_9PLEO|nr:uncharacterized protein CC84DRAFT_383153 [Paraphaeosphaeria sporulosa]OAF99786.1 hypothetical protein CC84DRAFT_383153 [Paraphaeosphaeria sporulosa]